MSKQKMSKDLIPENFTLGLALVDAIPVIFFGASAVVISLLFGSRLFLFGALLCLFGGAGKVLWKIIVAVKRKNIWWMFVQMRVLMPIGFCSILLSLLLNRDKVDFGAMGRAITSMPSVIFFGIGIVGMLLMSVFAVKLDNSDVRANWVEQLTNGIAQIAIFVGLLFLL